MNQKKIAEMAHVSPSTVSKALRGSKDVSLPLAEKIRRIAMENGYVKEKSERKLSNLRQNTPLIAIFCPEIISVYYSHNVTRIQKEIEALGGETFICVYNFSDEDLDRMVTSVAMRNGCDAIIAIGNHGSVEETRLPIAYVDVRNARNMTESISYNSDAIMDLAVTHLQKIGCKRIGYMGEVLTASKQEAFLRALHRASLSSEEAFCFCSERRFEYAGYDCAARFLECKERPDGVVAAYDEIALGAMHHLLQNGLSIPDDVAFVGINNIPFSAYAGISLTSIKLFSEEKCSRLIQNLFRRIADGNRTPLLLPNEPELIPRDSTARKQ